MSGYPQRPADMPVAVEWDCRCKVNLHWYESEEDARYASEYFVELARARARDGYDFGYWNPGYQGKSGHHAHPDKVLYLAVEG